MVIYLYDGINDNKKGKMIFAAAAAATIIIVNVPIFNNSYFLSINIFV